MPRFKKILTLSIFALFLLFVSGCGSSKNLLLGEWKAQTGAQKTDVVKFDSNKVTVNGQEFDYKVKSTENKGDIIYYQIEQNGELFTVIFPDKDRNIAVMIQPYKSEDPLSGKLLYAMNKNEQPNYSEYAKKYVK